MALELEGRVVSLLPEQSGNGARGEWFRAGFVIKTEGEYPRNVCFEVLGRERWERVRQYLREGGLVKVSFDVSSREWQGRWFTSLTAFSVFSKESELGQSGTQSVQQSAAPQPQPQPQQAAAPQPQPQPQNDGDDLPF